MMNTIKNILISIFFSIVFISYSHAYDTQKGKIDMHGGKSDTLTTKNAFGIATTLGSVLSKKGTEEKKEIKKENKKFIEIDKIEKIQEEEQK